MMQAPVFSKTLAVLGGAAVLGGGMVCGSPVATAQPDVTGMTYGDASSALSSSGYSAVVGTVVGAQAPLDECYVVGTTSPTFLDVEGSSTSDDEVVVSLSCYSEPASETGAGISAGNTSAPAEAIREATEEDDS